MKLALCIRREDAELLPHVPNLSTFLQTRKDGSVLDCEKNNTVQQVIPYIVLLHRDKVLVYQRGRGGNEAGLHDEWSIGFGGHVETAPQTTSYLEFAKLMANDARREVLEESGIELTHLNVESIEESILGARWMLLLNGNGTEVDNRHIGFVCCVELNDEQANQLATKEATKIINPHWRNLNDDSLLRSLESWSQITWNTFLQTMQSFYPSGQPDDQAGKLLVHAVTNAYMTSFEGGCVTASAQA